MIDETHSCRCSLTVYARRFAALVLLCVSANAAAITEIDGIVAVVDDDVVLASELFDRLTTVRRQIAEQNVAPPPDDVLVSQILERLIVENLQLQHARRRGLEIDDETLTRAVQRLAEQNGMGIDAFRERLASEGMSYRELRSDVEKEMMISRLQRGIVTRRIVINDKDIDDLLNSPYYQGLLSDEFRVGHILLSVEDNASESTVTRAMSEAEGIVAELRSGADFAQTAIARSSGSRALEGGDLGWRRAGELPSLFAERVLEMTPGETAEPILSGSGVHIIQLLERRGAGMERENQSLLRHILVRPSEIRSEAQTETLIRDLHARLESGADFEALAKEYSEDPGSALNGGELGWTAGDEFVPSFQTALRSTPTGALSPPFRTEYGWHVLEVMERREQDMSEEARRNMALQILHSRRFDEELQAWLRELRDEAYVEIRL